MLSAAKDVGVWPTRSLLSIPRIDGRNRFARCAQDDSQDISQARLQKSYLQMSTLSLQGLDKAIQICILYYILI